MTVDDIQIRTAEPDDLAAIVAMLSDDPLGRTREHPDGSWAAYRQAFDIIAKDPNNHLIVAAQAGRIIGCLQLTFLPGLTYTGRPRAQIEGVRIAEASRGSGAGRIMIEHALTAARAHNCVLAQLTSDKRRPEAVAFYEALGFKATHEGFKLWF